MSACAVRDPARSRQSAGRAPHPAGRHSHVLPFKAGRQTARRAQKGSVMAPTRLGGCARDNLALFTTIESKG